MFFLRWIVAGLIVRSADATRPRAEVRFPRLTAAYDWLGRAAAWGFVGLIALTVFVALPLGFVSWMMTK